MLPAGGVGRLGSLEGGGASSRPGEADRTGRRNTVGRRRGTPLRAAAVRTRRQIGFALRRALVPRRCVSRRPPSRSRGATVLQRLRHRRCGPAQVGRGVALVKRLKEARRDPWGRPADARGSRATGPVPTESARTSPASRLGRTGRADGDACGGLSRAGWHARVKMICGPGGMCRVAGDVVPTVMYPGAQPGRDHVSSISTRPLVRSQVATSWIGPSFDCSVQRCRRTSNRPSRPSGRGSAKIK